ncbi:MAG: 50S ribosomal protein L35 [Spirochaetia bacterium]|nr:50S ribosomal protein L35 [Spirochaetia bacterium]
MPKIKTNSCAKKRLKITGGGRIKYKKPGLRHLLQQEPSDIKRPKRKAGYIHSTQETNIKKMLPYG